MDKNFRQVAAEWAVKKAIDDSVRTGGERCPKTALGLAHRSRVGNQCGDFSGPNGHGLTPSHCNRQRSVISRKQLPSTFHHLLKIRGLDQYAAVNEECGFIEFWF